MASVLHRILREDERQEKLLEDAIHAADALSPEGRRRLYRHLVKRIEAEATGTGTVEPKRTSSDTKSNPKPTNSDDKVPFTEKAEEFVFANGKKGVTTRQVADHIGQNYGSAHGTLHYVAEKWETIVRRDDAWFPAPNAKRRGSGDRPVTIGETISAVFRRNGNTPLAAKDIFKGVKATLPDAKKGSVDAQLVGMRKDGTLVQNGEAPHGGGLYHLADHGGASTANAN